ncbi:hypothetical protein [Paenisporosarcina indica]|uniref:hypothetical protein n=1 Tax=Paenisporosarcina indica TaxID=650093 RepID=UPI00094FE625|nr:hypothetical protein [Paenisporosarcina indica]
MKNFLIGSLMIVILLSLLGCQQNKTQTENNSVQEGMKGFVEPEPSDWVKYIKPITEYMYYRTQAVVNNDINILWDQYQALKDNIDLKQGINVEKYEVESLNESFELIDANFNIESNGRIKVKTINDNEVIVLIHSGIAYLRNDFGDSGGEHLIKVFLEQKDNHWTVVKTDEYTLPEYKEWVKQQEKE